MESVSRSERAHGMEQGKSGTYRAPSGEAGK